MIEVRARARHRLGQSPTRFLEHYWQKRPLVIRGAFADLSNPLPADQLAGLACEADIQARLVVHDRKRDHYRLEHGPFDEDRFAALGHHDWTLLVQDADKWLPDTVGGLLAEFGFLPRWRIDDIMISFAVPGGSVGPHVDQYDVFLVQVEGRREWRIDAREDAPSACRPDQALRILECFEASHVFVLEPGDMLYLPPGVPHHGVALDPCLTWSVGMRAPSTAELAAGIADGLAEHLGEASRYCDPDLKPARHPAELDGAALARARATLDMALADDALLYSILGDFLSRYRSAQVPAPRPRPIGAAAFGKRLLGKGELLRNPWSRMIWHRHGEAAVVHLGGERYDASLELARTLDCDGGVGLDAVRGLVASDLETLRSMINAGHLEIVR
ncbi:MAG TPA: cupin domain-containing protein [Xanthomonadaceae bacterium]|nr:cupin domain-containing protein [Xanthomonadaceae bacterium]